MENRYANKFYMVTPPPTGCSPALTERTICSANRAQMSQKTAAGTEDGSISV